MHDRAKKLERLAMMIGGDLEENDAAAVTRNNVKTVVRYEATMRWDGRITARATSFEVRLYVPCPLAIYVQRVRWLDRRRIARGEMIDLDVGEPDFDRRLVIEAAPAELVKQLLDEPARRFIAANEPVVITGDATGRLRLQLDDWIESPRLVIATIDMLTALARQAEALASARARLEHAEQAPFRPIPSDGEHRASEAAWADEVAALEELRGRRERRGAVWGSWPGLAVPAAAVGWLLYQLLG